MLSPNDLQEEACLGEALATRTERLVSGKFDGTLGPPDLCTCKMINTTAVVNLMTGPTRVGLFCHCVGQNVTCAAAISALFQSLLVQQQCLSGSWWDGGQWKLEGGVYCCYNAVKKVDVRVEIQIPGAAKSMAVNAHGQILSANDSQQWDELFVSAALRALRQTNPHRTIHAAEGAVVASKPLMGVEEEVRFSSLAQRMFWDFSRVRPLSSLIAAAEHCACSPLVTIAVQRLMRLRRYSEASSMFNFFVPHEPLVAAYVSAARRRLATGRWVSRTAAMEIYRQAIALLARTLSKPSGRTSPLEVRAVLMAEQVDALLGIGETESAIQIARTVVQLRPNVAAAWVLLARVYIAVERHEEALTALNQCGSVVQPPSEAGILPPPPILFDCDGDILDECDLSVNEFEGASEDPNIHVRKSRARAGEAYIVTELQRATAMPSTTELSEWLCDFSHPEGMAGHGPCMTASRSVRLRDNGEGTARGEGTATADEAIAAADNQAVLNWQAGGGFRPLRQATEHHGWGLRGVYLDIYLILAHLERVLGWRRFSALRERVFFMSSESTLESESSSEVISAANLVTVDVSDQSKGIEEGNSEQTTPNKALLAEEELFSEVEAAMSLTLITGDAKRTNASCSDVNLSTISPLTLCLDWQLFLKPTYCHSSNAESRIVLVRRARSLWNDVSGVCEELLILWAQHLPLGPSLGIKPLRLHESSCGYPMTMSDPDLCGEYEVQLTPSCLLSRRFNQLVYQLGHEMAHVYISPKVTGVFIEALAIGASFACLALFAQRWRRDNDTARQDYATKFTQYWEGEASRSLKKNGLKGLAGARRWVKEDLPSCLSLGGDAGGVTLQNRGLQKVMGVVVMETLLEHEDGWGAFATLSQVTRSNQSSIDLPVALASCERQKTEEHTFVDFEAWRALARKPSECSLISALSEDFGSAFGVRLKSDNQNEAGAIMSEPLLSAQDSMLQSTSSAAPSIAPSAAPSATWDVSNARLCHRKRTCSRTLDELVTTIFSDVRRFYSWSRVSTDGDIDVLDLDEDLAYDSMASDNESTSSDEPSEDGEFAIDNIRASQEGCYTKGQRNRMRCRRWRRRAMLCIRLGRWHEARDALESSMNSYPTLETAEALLWLCSRRLEVEETLVCIQNMVLLMKQPTIKSAKSIARSTDHSVWPIQDALMSLISSHGLKHVKEKAEVFFTTNGENEPWCVTVRKVFTDVKNMHSHGASH